jgi:hypothetical protein
MEPLRYFDGVEAIDPDEQQTFDKIIAALDQACRITWERDCRAFGAPQADAHGLLRGALEVKAGLPAELRQGLFAQPKTYQTIVRLAHVAGELPARGMAIKIVGVDGPMLPGHEGRGTQDFVLETGKVFSTPTAKAFFATLSTTEKPATKSAVPAASLVGNAALNAVIMDEHSFNHALTESYFSQMPMRYGDYIAKMGVYPGDPSLVERVAQEFELKDANGLRAAVAQYFCNNPVSFDMRVQLCTDLKRMPVENASTEWPEDESPYTSVGRLMFPPQDAFSPERQSALDQGLFFCPSHSMAAHRPLGSISRLRMKAYEALATRLRDGGRVLVEPISIGVVAF